MDAESEKNLSSLLDMVIVTLKFQHGYKEHVTTEVLLGTQKINERLQDCVRDASTDNGEDLVKLVLQELAEKGIQPTLRESKHPPLRAVDEDAIIPSASDKRNPAISRNGASVVKEKGPRDRPPSSSSFGQEDSSQQRQPVIQDSLTSQKPSADFKRPEIGLHATNAGESALHQAASSRRLSQEEDEHKSTNSESFQGNNVRALPQENNVQRIGHQQTAIASSNSQETCSGLKDRFNGANSAGGPWTKRETDKSSGLWGGNDYPAPESLEGQQPDANLELHGSLSTSSKHCGASCSNTGPAEGGGFRRRPHNFMPVAAGRAFQRHSESENLDLNFSKQQAPGASGTSKNKVQEARHKVFSEEKSLQRLAVSKRGSVGVGVLDKGRRLAVGLGRSANASQPVEMAQAGGVEKPWSGKGSLIRTAREPKRKRLSSLEMVVGDNLETCQGAFGSRPSESCSGDDREEFEKLPSGQINPAANSHRLGASGPEARLQETDPTLPSERATRPADHEPPAAVPILEGLAAPVSNFQRFRSRSQARNCSQSVHLPVPPHLTNQPESKGWLLVDDISNGKEELPISCVDEVTEYPENPPPFKYMTSCSIAGQAEINCCVDRMAAFSCDCANGCGADGIACCCSNSTRGKYAYDKNGRLIDEFAAGFSYITLDLNGEESRNGCYIQECGKHCSCGPACRNRVVQHGIQVQLQLFMTKTTGWGVRPLQHIPKGTFIYEYIGEITTNTEQMERNLGGSRDSIYQMQLDADGWFEKSAKFTDQHYLNLDATHYGNIARFMNHRCCDANLVQRPVHVESHDTPYYHVAFFAARDIKKFEELTWDYGDMAFEEGYEQTSKGFRCHCDSAWCRDSLRYSEM